MRLRVQCSRRHHRDQGRIQDFKRGGGGILGLQAKKDGSMRGPILGPMLKEPT